MEAQANAAADEIVTAAWGGEELGFRKAAKFEETMYQLSGEHAYRVEWKFLAAEAKRLRGEA